MAKLDVLNKEGKSVGSVELADSIAKFEGDIAVLHRAVVAEEANKRQGTSKVKGRSEVRGGGRKPYRQKKTGRARQGTIRSPLYAHGGAAHPFGPRDYGKKLNKKERRTAILGALASKVSEGTVVVADKIAFAEPKTKEAAALLKSLGLHDVKRLLVVLAEYDETTLKSFRNLPCVSVRTAPALPAKESSKQKRGVEKAEAPKTAAFSARDLLVAHKVLFAKEALVKVQEVWGK